MKALTLQHPEATRARLLSLAEEIPGAWIGIKIAGLLLLLEGQRSGWITDVLGLTRMSWSRWVHSVNQSGVEALKEQPRPGRPVRLSKTIQKSLEVHLEKTPMDYGLSRVRWDGPTLVVHLKKKFGIALTVRHAQRWMHQLGYRMKRASHVYLQARAEDTTKFRRRIKKTPNAGTA